LDPQQLIKQSNRPEYLFPLYRTVERATKEFKIQIMTSKEDA